MQNINLLDSLPGANRKFLTAVVVVVIVVTWILVLLFFYTATLISASNQCGQVNRLQKEVTVKIKQTDAINTTIIAIRKSIDSAKNVNTSAESAARQAIIATLQQGKTVDFVRYFSALAQNTPKGIWLTSFSFSVKDKTIMLSGNAKSPDLVPDFIHSLSISKIFKGSKFHTLKLNKVVDHYSFVLQTEMEKKV